MLNSGNHLRLIPAIVLIALLAASVCLAAQQEASDPSVAPAALPADRLIELLQQNPDALDETKVMAAKYLQAKGVPIQSQNISDDVVFARIEQDPEFRARLTEAARARGLPENPEESVSPQPRVARPNRARSEPPRGAGQQHSPAVPKKQSPYADLPSLRDLYTQVSPQNAQLSRFGLDIFRRGTGNLDNLPADLPAGPDYVLGPGDGINIDMWGGVSQRVTRTVDREGRIVLPEAGAVDIAGLTLGRAQDLILKTLTPQFRNVRVDVSLTRLRSVRIYVVGDVERPGAYDISSLSTPLNALYTAGGPAEGGSLRSVRHYRGKELISEVDLYDLLLRGVRSEVARLEPGDTILVPPVGSQVTVAGMVKRPAIYELKHEKSLSEVLDLAGGVLVSATLGQITVDRIEAYERRTLLSLNLPATADVKAVRASLGKFQIQDADRITISSILPYSEKTVYLEGHVFRPGRYPYREGMQLRDLLRSYQETLPEPADHAELIRLDPPDYRPRTIEIDLGETLRGEGAVDLQPFDTVRVFGRYEVDPPQVAIYGEVLRPGPYPLSGGMTAAGLLRMAGGFKRSAMPHTVDVASYIVKGGEQVELNHRTVEVAKALAGDANADVALKPGDVLSVRQLTGWNDIGGAVTLGGEVNFPGTFALHKGERLSSVLKRAGGFRPTAYPAGAALERVEVRAVSEKSRAELIRRIESSPASLNFNAAAGQDRAMMLQAIEQQQQQTLVRLRSQPASGRLVIQITSNIEAWQNTAADIELRPGDTLHIPDRPDFVLITGQVYSPSAIGYTPGRTAASYLRAAGGTTEMANKKAIFVVRANGSVSPIRNGSWFKGSALDAPLQPGDTIVVPEKVLGGNPLWRELLNFAQISSGLAIAARVATSL